MLNLILITCLCAHSLDTVLDLEEGSTISLRSPHSSNNAFILWDIRAPQGKMIVVAFHHMEIESSSDDKMFLYYGENAETLSFSIDSGSCSSWTSLTERGEFNNAYSKFVSRSSSVKLILSTLSTRVNFSLSLRPVEYQGIELICLPLNIHCRYLRHTTRNMTSFNTNYSNDPFLNLIEKKEI